MFSLTLREKYKCTSPQNSIYRTKDYGPVFGGDGGNDIALSNNAHDKGSFAAFPSAYNM